jgi:hypothetical protein
MKLEKIEQSLEGDQYWPKIPIVHVEGDKNADPIPLGATQEEGEKVIRSWDRAAVLRVAPADGKALIGFWTSAEHCQYLNVPIKTTENGTFAMRIGDKPVDFFIVPQNHNTSYRLELIEETHTNDPKYKDVPLY